jgi:hypothetical protein
MPQLQRALTLNLRTEFFGADLNRIHSGTSEGQDETPPIQSCDLRPFALRDLTPAIPVDRRSEAQILSKLLGRRRVGHDACWQFNRDRGQRESLPSC